MRSEKRKRQELHLDPVREKKSVGFSQVAQHPRKTGFKPYNAQPA